MNESMGESTWKKVVDSWRGSGLGQLEYCIKNKIRASAFYYWRKKIDGVKQKPGKAKKSNSVSKIQDHDLKPDFIEINIPQSNMKYPGQVLRITTSYGAVMEMPL